jgi:hypothetical protein
MAKTSSKENLELAKEHIDLAADLIATEGKKADSDEKIKKFAKAEFDLEKTESDLDDLDESKE